jgi:cofilin
LLRGDSSSRVHQHNTNRATAAAAARYYIYRISDSGKEIVIDCFGTRDASYEDFTSHLPPNECRYGLFDLDYETADRRPASKLVFIAWTPDTAPIRIKMMYAGSKEALKSALVGVGVHLQVGTAAASHCV